MPKESQADKLKRTGKILVILKKTYPDAQCSLTHGDPLQLLIATILSAQCTDARVNMVTPVLFKEYPSAAALAAAPIEKIEKIIQSTGFYRAKAKSIKATATDIAEKFGGKVPDSMEQLVTLRGVGRKTANVVLGNAYGQNVGVVVDTHVGRLSLKLGLTTNEDPVKVEQDLMKLIPQNDWTLWSHLLIDHGRAICNARAPKCDQCPLRDLCPTGKKAGKS